MQTQNNTINQIAQVGGLLVMGLIAALLSGCFINVPLIPGI